jgi:hypothetical protein
MTPRDWKLAGRGYPRGTWRLEIDARGAVDVFRPHSDKVDFSTEFGLARNRLTIDSIPICPGTKGRYTWRATPRELTLTVVDDAGCAPRAALFGGTWRRRS